MLATEIAHDEYHNSFVLLVPGKKQHEKISYGGDDVHMIDGISEHENLDYKTDDGLEKMSHYWALRHENVHELSNENLTD